MNLGAQLDFSAFEEKDLVKILFAENIGIVLQAKSDAALEAKLNANQIEFFKIGNATNTATLEIADWKLDI
ncbi:MAG: Phosphoribosylformylglycinamidine synthase, partial [Bacteroidota bacterium]